MATLSRTITRAGGSFKGFTKYHAPCPAGCRRLSAAAIVRSGHNRWSKIKHDKGKADERKNKQRSVLADELAQASRLYGADPETNPRLSSAVATAKKASLPKALIESAIARGQGISASGAALDSVLVGAILPPSAAFVIDCQTDSKARLLQDLRLLIKNYGGNTTPTGYLFEKKGRIVFERDERGFGIDEVLDEATNAGAEDLEIDAQGNIVVFTDPINTSDAASKLSEGTLKLKLHSSNIVWLPNPDTMVSIDSPKTIDALGEFVEKVREEPAVQGVYMNIAPAENMDEQVWKDFQERI
ncbi:MAG: hypothetical protein M4579_003629 [Chaenotheca gracillima]|nr:MAG: hypothetical protein M4579_003629 [Chaenotheca gracillima]